MEDDVKLGEVLAEALSGIESTPISEIKSKMVYPCQDVTLPGVSSMVGLEDINFLESFGGKVSLYLVRENEFISLLAVFGNGCKNIFRAQLCISRFLEGVLGGLFFAPCAVESKIDSLMLESRFDYGESEEMTPMVSSLLRVLKSERFREEAAQMLECFE